MDNPDISCDKETWIVWTGILKAVDSLMFGCGLVNWALLFHCPTLCVGNVDCIVSMNSKQMSYT